MASRVGDPGGGEADGLYPPEETQPWNLRREGLRKAIHRLRRTILSLDIYLDETEEPSLQGLPIQELILTLRSGAGARKQELLEAVASETLRRMKVDAKMRFQEWKGFAMESVIKGGREAHRFIKGPAAAESAIVGEDEDGQELPLAGQQALERLLQDWLPIWQRPDRDAEEDPRAWDVQ